MADVRKENTIFIFNARDDVRYLAMKEYFKLSDDNVYNTINGEFELLLNALSNKGIKYDDLKGALLPNQDKDRMEICFVIDSEQIESNCYGNYVFSKLLPVLDKQSSYSVLCGDYIDFLRKYDENSQLILMQAMNKAVKRCNKSAYMHSSQYFLIYFSRLTKSQFLNIVKNLIEYPWFTGYADVTHLSKFKTMLSRLLTNPFIKYKDTVILPHPVDCSDDENINVYGYAFEKNAFKVVSVNGDSFSTFLSYKIESHIPDEDDIGFSFNALFPKFDGIKKLRLKIADDKWGYLTTEGGKGKLVNTLGFTEGDKDKFIREVYKSICSNYIYKLERKKYGDEWVWKFCVCIDMLTVNCKLRKTTVALKYFPDKGEMYIVTVT